MEVQEPVVEQASTEAGQPAETQTEHTPAVQAEPQFQIPERFQGKPPEEIAKAYVELEQTYSRHTQEVGDARNKVEQLTNLLLEKQQREAAQNAPAVNYETPEQIYEREFAQDPKKAIANFYVNKAEERELQSRAQQTTALYQQAKQGQIRGYEDFAQLEPTMAQVALRYQHMINPKYANSPEMLEVLTLAARGASMPSSLQQARNEGANAAQLKAQEAQKAFMETGGGGAGTATTDLSKMSVEQLDAYIESQRPR